MLTKKIAGEMAEQATPNGASAPLLLGSGTDPNGTMHFADGNCMTNAFNFHAMHTKNETGVT